MSSLDAGNSKTFFRFSIAVLAVVAAFLLYRVVGLCIDERLPPFVTFYPAIMVAALFAGFWPGLLATALASLLAVYWVLPLRGSFAVAGLSNVVALAFFLGGGVFISVLAERYRANQRQMADYKREHARQTEEQLQQVSEYHSLALEAAELGAWDYRFQTGDVVWDECCRNIFGVATGDHFDYQACIARIHPEDRPVVDEAVKQAIAGTDGGAYHKDFRVLWPDASIHWVESHGRVSFDGEGDQRRAVRFIGVNRDSTRHKQAEEALRSSQAKLHGIVSSAMDAVISIDDQQRIVVFNRAAETVFQCSESEALGSSLDRFIPHTLREAHREQLRLFGREGVTHRSANSPAILTGLRASGEEFPLEATISQAQAEGQKFYTVILRDITERNQSEEVLRKQAELIDLAHNTIMVWNLDGTIRFWNRGAEEMYAYPKHQAIGRFVHDLLRTVFPQPLTEIETDLLRRGRWEGELTQTAQDGTTIVVSSRWVLQRDSNGQARGVMEINNDITERIQAEQALRASEQRWATTLQSIGDAVISTDVAGNIEFMNEVAERLTGWPLSEAKGKHLSNVFSVTQEVTRILPECPVTTVLRSGKVVDLSDRALLIARDGAEIPIQDSAAPIRGRSGQIEGVVLVFQDVVEQRKAEKALRISDRLATTGRLAATIAHEIHNPLDAVSNLLYLIAQGTQEDLTRKYASTASHELLRITQMTQRMLAFQREAAKPVPVKIAEILESVTDLYERKIKSTGITLKQQIDFDGQILALPGELRQMFANLVGNAIEAVAARHGTITVRAYASRDWRRHRPGLRVVVADDGPGIPPEVRARIFEPFFTTKGESGTGLGLWIASEILRKYDGTLHLRTSTQPHLSGACFSIFLPFDAVGVNAEALPTALNNHNHA